mgnify:CR=1 FL=1
MLQPKKQKFRKQQRGRRKGIANKGTDIEFGSFGLQCLENDWITARQIEAARVAMTRYIKRGGRVYIRIFPDKPFTKIPAETRMGKGKGSPEYFVAVVKRGKMLFELGDVTEEVAREALRLASHKLPVLTKFVVKMEIE